MSDFINTVRTKDGTEYEVHDSRMPEVPSGGTKLYKHNLILSIQSGPDTYADLSLSIYNNSSDEINNGNKLPYAKVVDVVVGVEFVKNVVVGKSITIDELFEEFERRRK